MKTPEELADEQMQAFTVRYDEDVEECSSSYIHEQIVAAIEADRAQRSEILGAGREPEFAPADEPDKYRDLWDENMPRVSGCMYFAIPGEQPIHVDDDDARHILTYLSEKNR